MRGRQWTAAVSGSADIRGQPLALPAGDRAAQDHELGVDRQRVDLLGAALAVVDDGVVALSSSARSAATALSTEAASAGVHSASVV